MNRFTFPLILMQLMSMLIHQVAKILAGRTSLEALGSIAAIDGFLFALAGIFGVFTVSFNIFGSKALGEKDEKKFHTLLSSSLTLNLSLGVLVSVFILIFRTEILRLIYDFSGSLLLVGEKYLGIMAFYLLFTLVNFTFTNLIKIEKKTTIIFYISIASAILQAILSYLLIYGSAITPKLGLYGAGIATIVGLFFTTCCYVVCMIKPIKIALSYSPRAVPFLFSKSLPLVGQEILEGSIFIVGIESFISRMGLIPLASYSVSSQLVRYALLPMYMYCSAVMVMCGESYGQKAVGKLKEVPKLAIRFSSAFYFVIAVILFILRGKMIPLFNSDLSVVKFSMELLVIVFVANIPTIFYETWKYSLQSLDKSKVVLLATAIVNMITLSTLITLFIVGILNMTIIFLLFAVNYLVLAMIFRGIYHKTVGNVERIVT